MTRTRAPHGDAIVWTPFWLPGFVAVLVLVSDLHEILWIAGVAAGVLAYVQRRSQRDTWSDLGLRIAAATGLAFALLVLGTTLCQDTVQVDQFEGYYRAGWPFLARTGRACITIISDFGDHTFDLFEGPSILGSDVLGADYAILFALSLPLLFLLPRRALLGLTAVTRWFPFLFLLLPAQQNF